MSCHRSKRIDTTRLHIVLWDDISNLIREVLCSRPRSRRGKLRYSTPRLCMPHLVMWSWRRSR